MRWRFLRRDWVYQGGRHSVCAGQWLRKRSPRFRGQAPWFTCRGAEESDPVAFLIPSQIGSQLQQLRAVVSVSVSLCVSLSLSHTHTHTHTPRLFLRSLFTLIHPVPMPVLTFPKHAKNRTPSRVQTVCEKATEIRRCGHLCAEIARHSRSSGLFGSDSIPKGTPELHCVTYMPKGYSRPPV